MTKKKFIILLIVILLVPILRYREEIFVYGQQAVLSLDNIFYRSSSNLKHVSFFSDALQEERNLYVYLPVGYFGKEKLSYPTLYLLHGVPGNELDWVDNGNIQQTLDRLISEKQIKPVIVVIPDGTGPVVEDGQYVNADFVDQKMEDYIAVDLLKYVDEHYRTEAVGEKRAIGGNSSGAFGALNIALHHPELFRTVLALSGYSAPLQDDGSQLLSPEGILKNSILPEIAALSSEKLPRVFLYYGSNDMYNFGPDVEAINLALKAKKAVTELAVNDGFHSWFSWLEITEPALVFMDQQF